MTDSRNAEISEYIDWLNTSLVDLDLSDDNLLRRADRLCKNLQAVISLERERRQLGAGSAP